MGATAIGEDDLAEGLADPGFVEHPVHATRMEQRLGVAAGLFADLHGSGWALGKFDPAASGGELLVGLLGVPLAHLEVRRHRRLGDGPGDGERTDLGNQ